jgi:hypothetical protein
VSGLKELRIPPDLMPDPRTSENAELRSGFQRTTLENVPELMAMTASGPMIPTWKAFDYLSIFKTKSKGVDDGAWWQTGRRGGDQQEQAGSQP